MTAHAIATARPFATARGAPRWALVAAHLVPLVALPSGLWRIFVAAGASLGTRDEERRSTCTAGRASTSSR